MKKALFLLALVFVLFSCDDDDPKVGNNYNPTPYQFDQQIPERDFPLYIPEDNPLTVEGVELGKDLFNNKILSIDNELSCTSCHNPDKAFANNNRFDKGYKGKLMTKNTMSLTNMVFSKYFGWEGGQTSLEKAVLATIEKKEEFHETWDHVVEKLLDAGYADKFEKAFGTKDITADLVAKAIAQYIRSNISVNSKFDRAYYFDDVESRLSPLESKGYELFISEKGDCFHCHRVGPFFDNRFHNNGLDANPEKGLANVTHNDHDIGKFKTVTLRNVAVTAPYMHDGRFSTLEEVLDFYSDHVQYSPTLDPNMNHQGGISLDDEEKKAVIAFLKTLTDDKYLNK